MRQLLQGKAKTARAVSPKNNKETVTSVRTELESIKSLAPDLKESDDVSPDSPPSPPGHEASSREAQAAGIPPLPDLRLSPPPPSLGYRAGGTARLRHSQPRLLGYC